MQQIKAECFHHLYQRFGIVSKWSCSAAVSIPMRIGITLITGHAKNGYRNHAVARDTQWHRNFSKARAMMSMMIVESKWIFIIPLIELSLIDINNSCCASL